MSGEDKKKVIFKLKSVGVIALTLLALFGVEQALNTGARAKEITIFIREDPSVIESTTGLAPYMMPENEYLYARECASCHYLYSPSLLPARVWYNIINESNNHFGKELKLSYKAKRELTLHLTDNSTDKGLMSAEEEITVGLMDKKGRTTSRVSKTTYILDTHKGIDPELFTKNAAKTLSNCGACHKQNNEFYALIKG